MPSAASQPQVALNNGVSMPQLGLGIWRTPADETADVVRAAMKAGYLAVDTAAVYGNEDRRRRRPARRQHVPHHQAVEFRAGL